MNKDIYWEAQWAISGLEDIRQNFSIVFSVANEMSLDVLLQLKQ